MGSSTSKGPGQRHDKGTAKERLPLLADDSLNADQRRVSETLKSGPRRGVVGPFIPLLYAPNLCERIEALGSELRFFGTIDRRVHELVVCYVAAATHNQYEWAVHVPVALSLGVCEEQIESLRTNQGLVELSPVEASAVDFASSLLEHHDVSDHVYDQALIQFGQNGVVELTTIVSYFVMVSWLMNVAGTPAPPHGTVKPLPPPKRDARS